MTKKPPRLDPSRWQSLDSLSSQPRPTPEPAKENKAQKKIAVDHSETRRLLMVSIALFALIGLSVYINQKTNWLEQTGQFLTKVLHITEA